MAVKSYLLNGKKVFLVEVKMRDRDGKQIYRSQQGITSERKAYEVEFEIKTKIQNLINHKPVLAWPKWLNLSLEKMKKTFEPSTLYTYEKCLNRYVTPVWENMDVGKITQSDVHDLIFNKMPEDSTPHTRKNLLKLIRRVLQMAVEAQMIPNNPCAGLFVKATVNEQQVLGKTEVEILLREAKMLGHRFYPVWVMALKSGMRSGEMHALLWTDIDLEGKNIHLKRAWSSKNGLKDTKNGKSRVVPISDDLLAFLKDLRVQTGALPHVLPRLNEWDRGDQAKVLREFCKTIGITSIRFHDLRATFITNLLAQGVPLAQVMAIVGHSQIDTTNDYLRKAGVEVKGATNRLAYAIPTFNQSQIVQIGRFR
jgi:integrase